MTNAGYIELAVHDPRAGLPLADPQRVGIPLHPERLHAARPPADAGSGTRTPTTPTPRCCRRSTAPCSDAAAGVGLSNVKTMELSSAFNSHRLCDKGVGLLEEEGLSNWKATRSGQQERVVQPDPHGRNAVRAYELQEDIHPNYWAQLGAAQLPDPGLQRGRAQRRHVHNVGIGTELGRRAEHVAALVGARKEERSGAAMSRPTVRCKLGEWGTTSTTRRHEPGCKLPSGSRSWN